MRPHRFKSLLPLASLVVLVAGPIVVEGEKSGELFWHVEWQKATEAATRNGLPLFVAAIGTDWSAASKKFDREILQSEGFRQFAGDNLILYRLESNQPPLHAKQISGRLQAMTILLEIEEIPTFILFGPGGEEWLRHGYLAREAEAYVEALKALAGQQEIQKN